MLPRTIHAAVGGSLTVTCVIPEHLAGVYDSSQLAFDFQNASGNALLDDRLITRVNSTTAVLNYSKLSFDWNRAHIGCFVRDHVQDNLSDFIGTSRVYVYGKCLKVSTHATLC